MAKNSNGKSNGKAKQKSTSIWAPKVRPKKEVKLLEVTKEEYTSLEPVEWKGFQFLEKVAKYGKYYFKVKND